MEQSIRQIKSLVNKTFQYLESHDFPVKNYIQGVMINSALCSVDNKREVGVWEDEEVIKLRAASIELWNKKKFRYSALIFVMIYLGCRIGEISGTTWDDVDFDKRLIHIKKTYSEYQNYDTGKKCRVPDTTKNTSSTRTIQLNDGALEWLLEIKRRNEECGIESRYVVTTRSGRVPTQSSLDVSFARFCRYAGVPYRSSHTNRRTHVTTLLDSGVSVAEVSHNVGHKKISTTLDCYYKCKAQNNAAFVKAQNDAFNAVYGNMDSGDNSPDPSNGSVAGARQGVDSAPDTNGNIIDFGDALAARKKNLATAGNTRKSAS